MSDLAMPSCADQIPRSLISRAGVRTRRPSGQRPSGQRLSRLRAVLAGSGSAFVVAVAYVDPGNFATNMLGGASYGYLLLWVIVSANVLAMFVQYLSAKLGRATGLSLPELCRERLPRSVSTLLWVQAELVCMATDLAEFVGTAVALNLLFGLPMLPSALVAAVVSLGILVLAPRHRRWFVGIIIALLSVVLVGFAYQALHAGQISGVTSGLVPRLPDRGSLLLAVGIIGATAMPHVIYLHSALTTEPERDGRTPRQVLRDDRLGIFGALGLAGGINMLMLIVAAVVFHGNSEPQTLHAVHTGLGALIGTGAATAFAFALLASGLASSSVGTYAGDAILLGFLRRRIPLWLRRVITMSPALALLAFGVDPTWALVISQVVLSFGIPFALVPLVYFGSRRRIMGDLVNRPLTTVLGAVIAALLTALNAVLLSQYL